MPENDVPENKKEYSVFGRKILLPLWVTTRLIPILLLIMVVIIVGLVFYVYRFRPDLIDELKGLGYLGVFIISVTCNAVIILPVGNIVLMAAMAVFLPGVSLGFVTIPAPFMVAIIGGLGAGFGESTGYLAGRSGRAMNTSDKEYKLVTKVEGWIKKWGMLMIFVLSGTPFPFDIVGIVAGAVKFPWIKFYISSSLGRMVSYAVVCWAVVGGWDSIIKVVS